MHSCQNNLQKSYTEKKTKHTPSVYSLFANCSFDATKNKLNCYRGKDQCHYTEKFRAGAHSISNFRYKTPKEIPIVFHNGSIYDYYFIINKLAKDFDGQLECLGEDTETYITFSVTIGK